MSTLRETHMQTPAQRRPNAKIRTHRRNITAFGLLVIGALFVGALSMVLEEQGGVGALLLILFSALCFYAGVVAEKLDNEA